MLDLELLRMMDETQLINYVDSYGSEESIAVMNAILNLGKLENEAGQTLEEVTKENSRLIDKNDELSNIIMHADELISNNIANCFIEMFEKSNIKKKVTKELLDKYFNEIENSMTVEACEYLTDSIKALQYLKKYI